MNRTLHLTPRKPLVFQRLATSEHHFAGVNKMIRSPIPCSGGLRPSHFTKRRGEPATFTDSRYKELEVLNPKARELEARIAENVGELLEA